VTPDRLAAVRDRLAAHALSATTLTFEGGHRLDDDTLRQVVADGA
jgi:hypothetical protein